MAVQRYGKMFFFSTTLMLGSLHLVAWMGNDRSFSVRHVQVTGCQILQPEEIIKTASVPMTAPIMSLNLDDIQRRIEEMPLVQSVSVARQFPSTVAIHVTEVAPIALMNHNGLHPIDGSGMILRMPRRFGVMDVPVVSGAMVPSGGRLSGVGLSAIDYLAALKKYHASLYHDISEVKIINDGTLEVLLMKQGVPVRLGKNGWMEQSERLLVVLQHLRSQPDTLPVVEFDLRIPGQVIARNKT